MPRTIPIREPRLPVFSFIKTQVHLTARELEFIKLRVGEELSHKELAERMGIKEGTVKHFSLKIGLKLGISQEGRGWGTYSIVLTKFALRNKIIEL